MPNRKRNHSICLKLTDEEYDLWTSKQTASGLSKTDYLIRAISRSEVRIYSIEESISPLIHEIRKIGTNLNQLAYFSNIGQDERVRAEIGAIRRTNDRVMVQLSDFLKNPQFSVKVKA
ncbi:MAG: mobilization protein [Ruminococcus sp.]|nr:mobilization protein [Ruminococcus sp.]